MSKDGLGLRETEALWKTEIEPFIQLVIESVLKFCSVVLDVAR